MSPCSTSTMRFPLLQKAKCMFKVFLFSSASVPLERGGLFIYTPPVSGNILAPLQGFNGHDREYALKVNATSVRN